MNTPTVSHLYIYGIVFVITAVVSVSIAVAQEIGNENIPQESDTASVAIAEEDEPAPPDGPENQVQTGTPVTAIGIQAARDSGADDNITNHTRPVIEFTKASNGSITARYRKSGAAAWISSGISIATLSTSGTVTLPNLTTDGDYEVEITQTISSVAGKATYTFTLDTTAPTVYTGQSPFSPESSVKISDGGDTTITLATNDEFGSATALSGDGTLLAVGALGDDDGDGNDSGAVYLFEKQNGTWIQTLKISENGGGAGKLNTELNAYDYFGSATSMSSDGTVLVVGANSTDNYKGAVYLFEKSGGSWSQTLKIFDKVGTAGAGELDISLDTFDAFGGSASISSDGTLLAIGASGDDDGGNRSNRGAVYLFEKSNGTWSQSLKISDNNGGTGNLDVSLSLSDHFGTSTAISADKTIIAVGAYADDDGDGTNSGAVYLFEKSGGTWTQTLKISENGGGDGKLNVTLDGNDSFGIATALSAVGTVLAVGAFGDNSRKGAVYLFERSGGTWSQSLKISDNDGGAGNFDFALTAGDDFGAATALSADDTTLAIGSQKADRKGAVYLFNDGGTARSFTVTATDNEQSSTWEYTTITDDTCGAAQFTTTQTAYTEGNNITFSSESDTGKRVCFKTTDVAGNATVYTLSKPIRTIDRTAPTLTATRIGTGNSRTYRVRATDVSTVTGRTKDNTASSACTTGTATTGAGWSDYTPGEIVGTAHDTNGRCVIVTDALGHIAKIHLSDSDTVPPDFTLDLDANGSFEPNRDAILLYLYTNQGASASELTSFTDNGQTGTAAAAITKINEVKDSANTPLDMDGDGAFTANTDGIIPYLYTGQGYDATSLTSFTHNNQQTTADDAITLVQGTITPNWP